MVNTPLRGRTIRWTFSDGPMANKTFEHTFADDGTVRFKLLDGSATSKPSSPTRYECAAINDDVAAMSYLSSSGYTLTAVLDFRTARLVAFASNEEELTVQHGTFEMADNVAAHR